MNCRRARRSPADGAFTCAAGAAQRGRQCNRGVCRWFHSRPHRARGAGRQAPQSLSDMRHDFAHPAGQSRRASPIFPVLSSNNAGGCPTHGDSLHSDDGKADSLAERRENLRTQGASTADGESENRPAFFRYQGNLRLTGDHGEPRAQNNLGHLTSAGTSSPPGGSAEAHNRLGGALQQRLHARLRFRQRQRSVGNREQPVDALPIQRLRAGCDAA